LDFGADGREKGRARNRASTGKDRKKVTGPGMVREEITDRALSERTGRGQGGIRRGNARGAGLHITRKHVACRPMNAGGGKGEKTIRPKKTLAQGGRDRTSVR